MVAVKPKLSVAIQRRNRKRRRNNQLNRMQPEFLLDSSLLSAGNNQLANQFSGISPTLSSSSSSSASTSSLASIESACSVLSSSAALSTPCFASAAGQGDFQNYRTTVAAANLQSTIPQPQPQQQQHHNQYHPQQWHPGCYLSGLNINNNYLIPTAVYDNPNEVIDGSAGPQQQQLPNPPGVYTEMTSAAAAAAKAPEETQEVVFYDANNNPLSSWQEFILTANKSGPGERLFNTGPINSRLISLVLISVFRLWRCFNLWKLQGTFQRPRATVGASQNYLSIARFLRVQKHCRHHHRFH